MRIAVCKGSHHWAICRRCMRLWLWFDTYCQLYTAKAAATEDLPSALEEPTAPRNGFESLMSRVTEGRRARERLVTRDIRTELKLYLEELLFVVDE